MLCGRGRPTRVVPSCSCCEPHCEPLSAYVFTIFMLRACVTWVIFEQKFRLRQTDHRNSFSTFKINFMLEWAWLERTCLRTSAHFNYDAEVFRYFLASCTPLPYFCTHAQIWRHSPHYVFMEMRSHYIYTLSSNLFLLNKRAQVGLWDKAITVGLIHQKPLEVGPEWWLSG